MTSKIEAATYMGMKEELHFKSTFNATKKSNTVPRRFQHIMKQAAQKVRQIMS